jgi:HSP20 family protein
MSERDLLANFERMRREMDQLFGDVFERAGMARRRVGFLPAVDVAYTLDPPRAIVTAELAGIDPAEIGLEIEGRKLILSGTRRPSGSQTDVYQQVEIERGQFQRVIELGADVRAQEAKATYEDGMLRVELPLVRAELGARAASSSGGANPSAAGVNPSATGATSSRRIGERQ